MKILHLTAHVGGGVGKALSGLVAEANISGSDVQHIIICLEAPEKYQFVDQINKYGGEVIVCPSRERMEILVRDADIVQLEWWNHPATIKAIYKLSNIPMRLITWSHVSGLYHPTIPPKLILESHRFLFTSQCSLENKNLARLAEVLGDRVGIVSSSGGFIGLPEVSKDEVHRPISVGYFGSLNFAKLHPRYVDYISAVKMDSFRVKLIGDLTNKEVLNQQCEDVGKAGMFIFRGYTTDIAYELDAINVNAYLLNPEHYGTTENALLEAMAMGVVPIVLENPCECNIVKHGSTGLIVQSLNEFADAIRWLSENPYERIKLGMQASKSIRELFSAKRMETKLNKHYQAILYKEKRKINFSNIFGDDPSDWFLSCQGYPEFFSEDGSVDYNKDSFSAYGLFEENKGSIFHFQKYFSNDLRINQWSENLISLK